MKKTTPNHSGQTVRIGVIGCGAIADLFHLPVLANHPATRNGIALADPSQARLKEMSEKYTPVVTVENYTELLGHVDGVLIATPPQFHFEIAKFFLENNIPVLCEKPLTEDTSEARELKVISEGTATALAVNQTRRFFPSYVKIRDLIAEGELGTLERITYHDGIEFSWPAASPHHFAPSAKGSWSDTGVHLLDTICYWLGEKPELVRSQNDSQGGPEAMATVNLLHDMCEVEIKVSRLGRLKNGFVIEGSKGTIEAGAEDFGEVIVRYKNGSRRKFKCGSRALKYTDFAEPLIENFIDVIVNNAEPIVSVQDVVGTIVLLDEAYKKAETYPTPWNDKIKSGEVFDADKLVSPEIRVLDRPTVLITGASGFLGGRIAEVMQMSDFAVPAAAIRQWTRASRIARDPMDIRILDILESSTMDDALKGVDAIVHCAKTDSQESIVGGTRNLLEACQRNGVKRFVHISTAEVYGPVSGNVVETDPTPITGRSYGDWKVEAEKVCMEFNSKGVETAILRPSLIHGPYSNSWSTNMVKRLLSGKWGQFEEHGEGIANLIYVDDLVQAIFLCLVHPEAAGEAFNVNGPDKITWNQYFTLLNDELGREPLKTISASKSKLRTKLVGAFGKTTDLILNRYEDKIMEIYMRGGLAHRIMKKIKGEMNATPDTNELNDLFSRQAYYDDRKICSLLGYKPQFDIESSIRTTIEWLRLHEVVDTDRSEDAEEQMELVG